MFVAFIVTPLIEIAVLIQVGGWLGLWPTLGLIVLTAIIGTWMLRQQGFAVMARAQQQLAEGTVPLGEVFEGFCLVIAGALLLTPGFVTDVVGGSLLLPPVRAWLYKRLGAGFRRAAMPNQPPGARSGPGQGPVVDGDFETVEPEEPAAGRSKPESTGPTTDGDATSSSSPPSSKAIPMPPPRGRWDGKS